MPRFQFLIALAAIALAVCLSGCGPEPSAHAQAPTAIRKRPRPATSPAPAVSPSPAPPAAPQQSARPTTGSGEGWSPPVPLRDWEFLVVHHTATDTGDVATINKEHQKRKDSTGAAWRGIGYHFLIGNGKGMPDGAIEPTFRWTEQSDGAHAGSLRHNERGIGICLVGNFNKSAPTKKQLAALKNLMAWLQKETGIPNERILRHSDIKPTACPGKKLPLLR